MNALQIATMLRYLILLVGGPLVARGLVPQEVLDYVSDAGTLGTVIGAVGVVGTFVWGLWLRRKKGVVEDAASLSEVTTIKTTGNLANSVPSNKVIKDELR